MARKLSSEEDQAVRLLANGLNEAERQQLLADLSSLNFHAP